MRGPASLLICLAVPALLAAGFTVFVAFLTAFFSAIETPHVSAIERLQIEPRFSFVA